MAVKHENKRSDAHSTTLLGLLPEFKNIYQFIFLVDCIPSNRNYSSGRGILKGATLDLAMSEAEETPPETPPPINKPAAKPAQEKVLENKVVKLLERNPLGMTLPEMAGGPRQLKKIRLLRPLLNDAIKSGAVMPVSQRAGHTVYRLVKYLGRR
jgi:hypothetical protein